MTLRCILAPLASPDTLRGQVTDADWAAAAAFPPRRRAEYLTWRAVVYRELGAVPIGYDAAGGPVLIGDPRHIGVSHGGGHAAVVISDHPCAVDIEPETRRFTRAAAHFPYSGRGRTRRRSARGGRGLVRQGDALQAGPPSRNRPAARPRDRTDRLRGGRGRRPHPRRRTDPDAAGTARRSDRRPHPLIRSDIRRTAFSMQRPIRKSTATYAPEPGAHEITPAAMYRSWGKNRFRRRKVRVGQLPCRGSQPNRRSGSPVSSRTARRPSSPNASE